MAVLDGHEAAHSLDVWASFGMRVIMRERFRAFYPLSEAQKERAWAEGLIILDASSLLNLYRYPLAARERLLTVLEQLKERLWLPHQAALEYHRNQAAVRHEQSTQFRRVRDEIGNLKVQFKSRLETLQLKKRHALIDAEPLLASVLNSIDNFQEQLNQIEREQDERYQEESLQKKIEELFEGRVGSAPTQESLDNLYKEGAKRYERKMPPGYQDWKKGEASKEPREYSFGGLIFQRQFGDLIVWKEILEKTKSNGVEWFVFVTDDSKEDWWQVTGGQRTGPRPELLEEAIREGGVEGFILHTSEGFTEQAAAMLNIEVSEEVIQQISTTKVPEESLVLIEETGFLEKIADVEDGLEQLTQVAEGITLELNRIQAIMEEGTKWLKASKDARMKRKVTNDTAAQIGSVATRFEERVDAFEGGLSMISPGIDYILDRIEQIRSVEGQYPQAGVNLKSLFITIIGTVKSAKHFDTVLADMPDATVPLRVAIGRLRSAVQHYIHACSGVQRWLDRLG